MLPKNILENMRGLIQYNKTKTMNRDTAKKAAKRKAREANGHVDVIEAKDKNNPVK